MPQEYHLIIVQPFRLLRFVGSLVDLGEMAAFFSLKDLLVLGMN
jgi:hypothetical protein